MRDVLLEDTEVPVLIVGGSLVGMFMAALLGRLGVKALVAERHPGSAIHPRAAFVYQRSMEVVRGLGVEDAVRQKSFQQFEPDGAILSVESIAGNELQRDVPHMNEGVRDLSPSERLFITQLALEPMIKQRAEQWGQALHFATEVVSIEQGPDGVRARLRDRESGRESAVRARYAVAADGAHSRVREQLRIPMLGRGLLSRSLTVYFRANVGPLMRERNMSVILVRNPAFRGFFRIEKPYESGFLIIHTTGDPEAPNTDCWSLTEADCRELLRIGLGADVPVSIDSIQKWECCAHTAERFRDGRIFLAGDAAHVMPPYGGFGGNTGIHDAHNLAWKLAQVANGTAGEGLLDSYEAERRPVAHFTVEQAYARYVLRGAHYLAPQGISPFAKDVNVDLGYCYDSAAIVGDDPPVLHDHPRALAGRPGARAPHVALARQAGAVSSIDLFGRGWVLLAGARGHAWSEAAGLLRDGSLRDGPPLDVHRVDGVELHDTAGVFHESYGITPSGAVLVRPDGVVAWRSRTASCASAAELEAVLARLLARRERLDGAASPAPSANAAPP
ncbi:MAG TPA: FAD-dependent monooxygenase [Polyangiaceae bacterium]|nr:FAD-dependent monooxygenase [Polyangiaceae bacterium]